MSSLIWQRPLRSLPPASQSRQPVHLLISILRSNSNSTSAPSWAVISSNLSSIHSVFPFRGEPEIPTLFILIDSILTASGKRHSYNSGSTFYTCQFQAGWHPTLLLLRDFRCTSVS